MLFLLAAAGAENCARKPILEQDLGLVPQPLAVALDPEATGFTLGPDAVVEAEGPEAAGPAEHLADRLAAAAGIRPPVRAAAGGRAPRGALRLAIAGADPALGPEGYTLAVEGGAVHLRAPAPAGLARGAETLIQLLPVAGPGARPDGRRPGRLAIPALRITDAPRMAWRGMHLDVARHFLPVEFVKRTIDFIAMHKMNVFHWHLTDDQGWRLEVRRRPRLTEVGGWRTEGGRRVGGYYTHEDVREVVDYAARRFVTVVPEIEMPGHVTAALAAYPDLSCTGGPFEVPERRGVFNDVLCAGHEETFAFLEDVLAEVVELFPSPFVHVGGDECPSLRWQACARCRRRLAAEGLAEPQALEGYLLGRVAAFLEARGRRLVVWDDALEAGLERAPRTVVMSWRGVEPGLAAARRGHDVVLCPRSHCYFDYRQSAVAGEPGVGAITSLETVYAFDPAPPVFADAEAARILGAQANVWTEQMASGAEVEHMMLPRLCALAEALWSAPARRDEQGFLARLRVHYARLDAMGALYRVPPPGGFAWQTVFDGATTVGIDIPHLFGEVRYTLDGSAPTLRSPRFTRPLRITDDTLLRARTFLPDGRASVARRGVFLRQRTAPPAAPDLLTAPGLRFRYYEGPFAGLPDLGALAPTASGLVDSLLLPARAEPDRFAVELSGQLEVEAAALYTFTVSSGARSRLFIGDLLAVADDGEGEAAGEVALAAGWHPLRLLYWAAPGAGELRVRSGRAGKELAPIPARALSHPLGPEDEG